ncbi:MAG TPA: hypothetical protein VGW38_26295, partial [Chloroflexota bacterium]|nr:hypothetical protein [Chloroflexota bacterium]
YTTAREWIASEHYEVREVVIDGMRFAGTSHIDAKHLTVSAMERCLDAVVIHYDIAPEKQRLIAAVQHGLPLYGATLLEHWQARAAAYPDELARRMVREYLWLGPWYPPEAYVAREDTLLLYQHFCWMAQALIGILAGLNRLYYPSSEYTSFQQTLPPIKWADRFIGEMRLTPRDLVARLKQIFSVAPPEGWRELCRLIEETLALVEAHLPQVNEVRPDDARPEVSTTWARERFVDRPYTLLRTIGADAQYRWPGHRCS